jgi:CRISPR-associated protein Csd2
MVWKTYVPPDIQQLYEIRDFRHAAAILASEFPAEFEDLCAVLREFRFTTKDVTEPGGSESAIPKRFSRILRAREWLEQSLSATLVVDGEEITHDTHKVDYVKNRVAFDLEWNSKDQTFDRDLYAFRAFFEYDRISAGVLVTRSNELDPWFHSLGTYIDQNGKERWYKDKFGASTTHMGKLLPRLRAGRNGGCPVLVFGIKTALLTEEISDEQ